MMADDACCENMLLKRAGSLKRKRWPSGSLSSIDVETAIWQCANCGAQILFFCDGSLTVVDRTVETWANVSVETALAAVL